MSYRLSFWKAAVLIAVILAFVGTSHIVWAGPGGGNKGYIYVRRGEETVKAKKRLREKVARKKARQSRVRKQKPPHLKWVNIYFATGKAKITSPDVFKLNRAARLLKFNGQKKLLIIGSADRRGSLEMNQGLGLRRAKAVKNYLINKGISAKRIEIKSVGKKGASKKPGEEALARDRAVRFQLLLAGRKK